MSVGKKDNPFWIGSHKKCQLNVEGRAYMACIDVLNLKFHSLLESDDYDCEQGVWERLSHPKEESDPRVLNAEDVIMVFPYIFKAQY